MQVKKLFALLAFIGLAATMSAQTVGFTVLAGCKYGEGEGCDKAMDNNLSTKWGYYGSDNDQWIYFKTTDGEKIFLTGYAFVTANDNSTYGRLPKEWEIYGSNDENVASSTTLDQYAACSWTSINYLRGDDVMQEKNYTTYYYTLNPGSTSYKYFRVKIVYGNRNGFQISEFIPSYIVDNSGVTRIGDSDDGNFKQEENYTKAVDGNNDTKWGKNGRTGTLIFHTSSAVAVRGYTFVTGNDVEGRDPAAWTLYGQTANSAPAANDGNWEEIDSKSGISMTSSRKTEQHYNVENYSGKTYNYFKLYISNTKNDDKMQFSEFMLDNGSENQIEVKSGGSGYGGWETSKLFDGNSSGTWLTSNPKTYGTFVFGEKSERARSLTGYSIQMSGNSSVNAGGDVSIYKCRPKSWSIYGSNTSIDKNDGSWQLIHQVENDAALPENTRDCAYYHLDAPSTAYKYFKFVVEETQAGESENEVTRNHVAMGELVPFFTRDDQMNWLELRDNTEPVFNGNPIVKDFNYSFANGKKWGMICAPFKLTSNDNISYYTPSASTSQWLELASASTVDAYSPAVFNCPAASNISLDGTDVTLIAQPITISKTIDDWTVVGTTAPTTATNGFHITTNNTNEVYLNKTASTDLKPFRAYFSNGSASSPAYFAYDDLSKNIVLSEGENTDNETTFASQIATAKSSTDKSAALYDLLAARRVHAQRLPDIYQGSSTSGLDGKTVYLFNLGTGMFMGSGSDWNTHVAVDQAGIPFTMVADGDNYKMRTYRNNSGTYNPNRDDGKGWWAGGYVDNDNSPTTWHFLPVDGKSNVYNISQDGTTSKLVGYNPNGATDGKKYWSTVALNQTDVNSLNNQWKIITDEERTRLFGVASTENPVDVSYLIKNPSFIKQDGYDMYTKTGAGTGERGNTDTNGNDGRAENFGWKFYNISNFEFKQALTDLPAGLYEVGINGFYRDGSESNIVNIVNNNQTPAQRIKLFANDEESLLPSVASEMDKAPGISGKVLATKYGNIPTAPNNVFEYMALGYYKASVRVAVGTDGNLTIGVKKTEGASEDWAAIDNFRLKYLGGYREMDEDNDNSDINETAYVVKLDRMLKADKWNTFCVPFDMDKSLLGANAEVMELKSAVKSGDHYTMTFETASSIEANTPYMVKVVDGQYDGTIELTDANGIAVNTSAETSVTKDGVTFTGVFASGYAPLNSFIISNNVFYLVDEENTVNLKAFRGYITTSSGSSVKALNFTFEDEADAINEVNGQWSMVNGQSIYNLAGQRINKMQKGINIVNGKKILR